MTFPILTTPRLRLTEVESGHASALFTIFSNPEVVNYYGMDPMYELAQAEKIIEHFKSTYETKRGMRFAITIKDGNQFVGQLD